MFFLCTHSDCKLLQYWYLGFKERCLDILHMFYKFGSGFGWVDCSGAMPELARKREREQLIQVLNGARLSEDLVKYLTGLGRQAYLIL